MVGCCSPVRTTVHISLGDMHNCAQSVSFQGLVPLLPDFCQLSVLEVGVCGYIRKALEKGYLEHPGSTCCANDMFEIFVRLG